MTTMSTAPLPFSNPVPHPLGLRPEETRFPRPPVLEGLSRADKTRLTLMAATASEVYEKGYHAASLSDILDRAGVTKGALYHHFPDKRALALAAMKHFIYADLDEYWVEPLRRTDDPLNTLKQIIGFMHTSGALENGLKHGCPLVNLTEEMAQKDEDFCAMIQEHNAMWRDVFVEALKRGITAGHVKPDVEVEGLAMLVLAIRHGVISQAKVDNDMSQMPKCAAAMFAFLDSMRAGT